MPRSTSPAAVVIVLDRVPLRWVIRDSVLLGTDGRGRLASISACRINCSALRITVVCGLSDLSLVSVPTRGGSR